MKVAVLPYNHRPKGRLAQVPLGELRWPLGEAQTSGTIGDLGPGDHVILYPRSKYFLDPHFGVRCRLSLLIAEPYAVNRNKYLRAIALQKRFHRIITHRPAMARWVSNAIVMPFGGAWVDRAQAGEPIKTNNMSLIASNKKDQEGHLLRHRIAQWCKDGGLEVDLLGRGYRPFKRKEEGLDPYRYSVVIENCREEGYFSEKLIDCFLCSTMPIYWGAPDIERHFDPEGMIICQSEQDLKQAISEATPSYYDEMHDALLHNAERALAFVDYEKSAAERIAGTTSQR